MTKADVVVIGRNPNSLLGMIRAAGEAGCQVGVIKVTKKMPGKISFQRVSPQLKSKYVTDYVFVKEPDAKALIEMLLSRFTSPDQKIVLLPTDDYSAEIIDLHQNELKEYFLFPNINEEKSEISKLMDKYYQKTLAKKVNFPVAEGWSIKVENGRYDIPDGMKYPCYIKPETAIQNRKRYMGICKNKQDLVLILDKVAGDCDCKMLAEEYMAIEKELCVVGFCNKETVIAPAIIETVHFGAGSHAGVTSVGKVLNGHNQEILLGKITEFMKQTNLVGLFDIDLYQVNEVIYFNELNVRQGASGYAITLAGINLPEMLINALRGEKQKNTGSLQEITFVNDIVTLDDFGDGHISWSQYRRRIKSGVRFLPNGNDKRPMRYFVFLIFKQWLRRLKRKLSS